MDWFPWYPALYRADTLDLTLEQDGAYRRLIDHYMETRLPLPDNDNALARIIGISVNDFQAIAEQLRSKFNAKGGCLHSKRCDIELNRQDSLSRKRSSVAKAAHAKRNKNNDMQASAEQKQCNSSDTGQDRTGQDSKKDTNVSFDVSAAVDCWNELAEISFMPRVQKLTPQRTKHLKARLSECGGIEGWEAAIEKVRESPFLMGMEAKWACSFDWLVKPANFTKVMEGNYDRKATQTRGGGQADAINRAFDKEANRIKGAMQ